MIILLFGPPGSGKGTQAVHLAERFHIPAISTGDMFRAECQAGTELGKMASAIMTAGGLIPDEITNAIVASRISQPDCAHGFLLDGYPRTVPQAQRFADALRDKGLPDPIVIHLDVAEETLVKRLTARRQCPVCKTIYNAVSQPPRVAGRCDADGAELIARDDDQEATIRQRLCAYEESTGPILGWYGEDVVRVIDGAMAPSEVRQAVERAVVEALQSAVDA
ncbi:MAG: adenylate kinase [Bryobacteraceae bacterium]